MAGPGSAVETPVLVKTVDQLVEEARRRIAGVTSDEIAEDVASGRVLVVDVREPDEWEQGHIPQAINIPRGWLEFKADPATPFADARLHPGRPILVHCAAGKRSALACAALQDMGYAAVRSLEGGFEAWQKAGYPTIRDGRARGSGRSVAALPLEP